MVEKENNRKISKSLTEDKEGTVKLKRQLNLLHGVGIVSGLIIGGGIYISPKGVIQYAGSSGLSLIIWGIGGSISLLGALTFADIGLTIPTMGEKYVYIYEMYGDFIAYLYLWAYWFLSRIGANSIKCLTFGRYFLKPFFPDCEIPSTAIYLVGTFMACLGTFINCASVKLSARSQSFLTILSYLSLTLIIVSGFVFTAAGGGSEHEITLNNSSTSLSDLFLALYSTIFSFYGWSALNFVIEELKRPERNLPLAIIISVVLTTALYVLINYTYLSVIGDEGVLTSQAVAVSVSQFTLGSASIIIPILISLTALGSFNAGTLIGARFAFAGARRSHLPKFLSLISVKYLTPITALLLQLILSIVYIWTVELYTMVNNAVFIILASDLITVLGFIRMKLKGKTQTTFKLPVVIPIIYVIILSLLVLVPVITNPYQSGMGLLIISIIAVPCYVIAFILPGNKDWLKFERLTIFLQKLLYSAMKES